MTSARTSSPARAIGLTILFAEIAAVGGMLLSLAPGVPVSVFVTTISFVLYLAARAVAALRARADALGAAGRVRVPVDFKLS